MAEDDAQSVMPPPAPVQLRDVVVVRLNGVRHRLPAGEVSSAPPSAQLSVTANRSGEDSIQVEFGAEIAFESEPRPFEMRVTVVGEFHQVGELPSGETLDTYVSKIALSLLLPFLREQVFDLSVRLRLNPPIVMPLILPQVALSLAVDPPGPRKSGSYGRRPRRHASGLQGPDSGASAPSAETGDS